MNVSGPYPQEAWDEIHALRDEVNELRAAMLEALDSIDEHGGRVRVRDVLQAALWAKRRTRSER